MREKWISSITVLENELVDGLNLKEGDTAIDCTAGGGGHTALLLKQVGPGGRVYAFDRDLQAIAHLKERFSQEIETGTLTLINRAFSEFQEVIEELDLTEKIDGVCADIGVSSPQIDIPDRISFNKDGPLDMRMDQNQSLTAATIINEWDQEDLTQIFYQLGGTQIEVRR